MSDASTPMLGRGDQAAGLRRMMHKPKPRIVGLLSALDAQLDIADNLVFSLRAQAVNVQLLRSDAWQAADTAEVEQQLQQLASQHDLLLVDLADSTVLASKGLQDVTVLLPLGPGAEGIKQAYSQIKAIYSRQGGQQFGLVVHGMTPQRAQQAFKTLADVAHRYLRLQIELFGVIPVDQHLQLAAQSGRAVQEAFPLALASRAFRELAQRLIGDATLTTLPHAAFAAVAA
ncbi:MinD/ParA family ATP-binding protein [Methylobacillus flagellatus]|uniref:MinD/ParA family ATP-binding protein n=1 Tax=Methylobacillus flagellatus TaxID=405 RepID=UPI0010FA2A6A|nr:MinD/ParA family protein [Methylobacillus flagellatus]